MKYEIDGETADGITKGVLKETIKFLKKSIKEYKSEFKKGSKISASRVEDFENDIKYLKACETVYDFFGGNIK
jgi:hypothetical protein